MLRDRIKNVQIGQVLVARMASKEIQFISKHCHSVGIPRHRDHTRDLRLNPSHRVHVENVDVIETLIAVVLDESNEPDKHRLALAVK